MTGCGNEERNSQIINNACTRIAEQNFGCAARSNASAFSELYLTPLWTESTDASSTASQKSRLQQLAILQKM